MCRSKCRNQTVTVLVEFADGQGKTIELVPVPKVLLAQVMPSTPRPLLDVTAVEPLPGFVLRLTFGNGACKNFCVNGHLAGNCRAPRSDDGRSKESSTEGVAGQPAG